MTNSSNDLSPDDVRKAQALAPQLDPDIARAITEGNGPVIQAIANGATTDAQVAERLISMGLTTGLPPGVQQMVNEQMRQAADKREAESRTSEKQTAGMAGLALPGDSGEARAETSGSGRAWTQNIAEMDFGQKMSYLNDIEDMSFEKFAAKSDAERRKDLENIKKDAEARLSTAQGELARYNEKIKSDPHLGATPEERQRAAAQIDAATNIKLSGEESEAEISKLLRTTCGRRRLLLPSLTPILRGPLGWGRRGRARASGFLTEPTILPPSRPSPASGGRRRKEVMSFSVKQSG